MGVEWSVCHDWTILLHTRGGEWLASGTMVAIYIPVLTSTEFRIRAISTAIPANLVIRTKTLYGRILVLVMQITAFWCLREWTSLLLRTWVFRNPAYPTIVILGLLSITYDQLWPIVPFSISIAWDKFRHDNRPERSHLRAETKFDTRVGNAFSEVDFEIVGENL